MDSAGNLNNVYRAPARPEPEPKAAPAPEPETETETETEAEWVVGSESWV